MRLVSLRLQHFRVHGDTTLSVDPNVTVITGKNGSGKTSLLEALYIALQGSSFKGSDGDIVKHGNDWYRIDTRFSGGEERTVKFDAARMTGRKQFVIDDKTHYRLPQSHKYPVVLFEPDDLRLLHGSPTRRRQFIDKLLSQLDPKYALSLRRYDRVLKQRNALLKRAIMNEELFAWDVSLSDYGAYIQRRRIEILAELNQRLGTVYNTIAHTNDKVIVGYSEAASDDIHQKMLRDLSASVRKDVALGYTSVGPHRHDVLFRFNDSPAVSGASRGEVRSIVLALKFLEVDLIEALDGRKPIILLDDVFSELDESRQQHLTRSMAGHQLILSSATKVPRLKGTIIRVSGL